MIKKLIIVFILLAIAIGLGFLIHQGSGYVLISYHHWTAETSLWIAAAVLILFFIVFYFCVRIFLFLIHLREKIRRWSETRKHKHALLFTNLGLCEMAEGRFAKAEAHFAKAAKQNNLALIDYFAAARAAQLQKAYDRRDDYLDLAKKEFNDATLAIELERAQLQIAAEQWKHACYTLETLQTKTDDQPYLLYLLQRVYLTSMNWKSLHALLPKIHKYKILTAEELNRLEEKIYIGLLQDAADTLSLDPLLQAWKNTPKFWKNQVLLVRAYAQHLTDCKQADMAVSCLENLLHKIWDTTLITQYGLLYSTQPAKQLTTAESWLKDHPDEYELLLCLGRLSLHCQFWGKAKSYLEASLKLKPQSAAYYELGKALEVLGNKDAALEHYRLGAGSGPIKRDF